ncbi:MAG: FAD:protein FMN transferase, partial [Patescibacteria group bacterium]
TSPNHMLATWVIASTAMLADALATCLSFVPPERLQSTFDFEYLILLPDRSINCSKDFAVELFTN